MKSRAACVRTQLIEYVSFCHGDGISIYCQIAAGCLHNFFTDSVARNKQNAASACHKRFLTHSLFHAAKIATTNMSVYLEHDTKFYEMTLDGSEVVSRWCVAAQLQSVDFCADAVNIGAKLVQTARASQFARNRLHLRIARLQD